MRKYKLLILTVLVIILYNFIMYRLSIINDNGEKPNISFHSPTITMSVKDPSSKLLENVIAMDKEDGDITKNVIIESFSSFIEPNIRKVNFMVFDSDENLTRASCAIHYTDYTSPKFSLKNQLSGPKYTATELLDKMVAYSCVDGDISSRISLMNVTVGDNNTVNVRLSIADSTNTTEYLDLKYYIEKEKNIEIQLKDYLIYKKKENAYDYKNNILKVIERLNVDNSLIQDVKIEVPDMSVPGVYEVVYQIEKQNGNTGKTIMIVVVE